MEARELWGQLSGYCNTMVGLPQVLTQAVAVAMVPAIAAAYRLRNRAEIDENINLGMRISMIIGMPCAAGMIALAEPILLLLFSSEAASAISAAPTLMVMCLGVPLMALLQTTNGILQGVNRQVLPMKNLAIGAVAKIDPDLRSGGYTVAEHKGSRHRISLRIRHSADTESQGYETVYEGKSGFHADIYQAYGSFGDNGSMRVRFV